ncbi:MAG TPA: hypothetical protein VEA16_02770, partial [Vicinamibacterales bacterium]|nr:hypothetical protein [Vicinamibacterales bacterium]
PVVIGFGSLIKPQFVLYLGLLLAVEHSRSMAIAKGAVTALAAAVVHGAYYLLRPADWNEYAQAVVKRTVVERDFGWGPAAFMMHFSQSSAAGAAGYLLALAIAAALAYVAWRKRVAAAVPDSAAFVAALAFVVLTFANPRIPLYDLYAAALAVGVCCALSEDDRRLPLVLAALIAAGLLPWLIANFTRAPTTYSWVTTNLLHFHLLGIFGLLAGLAMTGYNRGRQRL